MPRLRAALLALMAVSLAAAEPLVLVGGYDPEVRAFALADDGSLRPLASSRIGANPSFLAVSSDGSRVYACNEVGHGTVTACRLDRATGALGVIGSAPSGGKGPCHVALHPSGRWLFAANYGDGMVAVLPLRADGGLGDPVGTVAAGTNAHMALPIGDRVYVPCKGADRVEVYILDPASGTLSHPGGVATAPGAGPRHLAFDADGRTGWLIDELASTLQAVAVDEQGGLSLGPAVSTLAPGRTGSNTAGGILLTDGLLLASNRGEDSVAVFRRGPDRSLIPVGRIAVGAVPRHLALSPDGRFVLVACQGAGRIEVLRLDPAAGALTPVGSAAVPRPAWVGCVP